jgi:hypothetical protein
MEKKELILELLENEEPLKRKLGKMVFDLLSEYSDDKDLIFAGVLFLCRKYPEKELDPRVSGLLKAIHKFELLTLDCSRKESWEIRTKKLENFSQASFEAKLIITAINICLLELISELHHFYGKKYWQTAFFFSRPVARYFLCFNIRVFSDFNHESVEKFAETFIDTKRQIGWQKYFRLPA